MPRAQPLFSYVNPEGKAEYAFRKFGFAHNPIVPHTVVRTARTCASCHANPRALGLGLFTSREHPKLVEFGVPIELGRPARWSDYAWLAWPLWVRHLLLLAIVAEPSSWRSSSRRSSKA